MNDTATPPKKAKDPYLEENRGFVTASKLKLFSKDPLAFYLVYKKELIPGEESKALEMGIYVDDYFNLGGRQEWEKKYVILEPKQKRTAYKGNKIPITNGDGKTLLAAFKEIDRQPILEVLGDYEKQKTITATYTARNGLEIKIKCTLDRLGVFKAEGYENHPLFGKRMIRDTKFIESVDKVLYKIDEYEYLFSMTFYNTVEYVASGQKESLPTVLDFIDKTKDNKTYSMILAPEKIEQERHRIIDILEYYAECEKNDVWPCYTDLHKDIDAHLNCERYPYNPAAIQKDFIPYQ